MDPVDVVWYIKAGFPMNKTPLQDWSKQLQSFQLGMDYYEPVEINTSMANVESQAQLEEIPIAKDEQNVYEEAHISQYMDVESAKKEEEDQTAGTPIHTMVETPQELAAQLAEED
uniref:Uncharacterized protein n=1 Tax=Romanomermis culicivorax TaxID=13658 RepID=A0A915KVX5_ROMCU